MLVAVADDRTFLRPNDDGVSRKVTLGASPPKLNAPLFDIASGAGLFVAVGKANQVFTFPEETTWKPRTVGAGGNTFRSVVFGNNAFSGTTGPSCQLREQEH